MPKCTLQWLRLLADKDDDKEKILDAFVHNEPIFSMLVGVRFQFEEKQLGDRINIRKRQKHLLIESSIKGF